MVEFDCTASGHDGVTLVTVHLRDIDVPTRVRVQNRLDGPVWPPRSEGVPEAGWTDTGFAGVVGKGSHALGYATPAPPTGDPAELVEAVPEPDSDPVWTATETPDDVVRRLGDAAPPADAVPAGSRGESTTGIGPDDSGDGAVTTDDGKAASYPASSGTDFEETQQTPEHPHHTTDESAPIPTAVEPWLTEMACRVDHVEALSAAQTLPAATAAVRESGGLSGVRDLANATAAAQLRTVARRARDLADRRAAATVPVETLSTLA